MSEHWWRAYDGAVDHAKLLLLSDRQHRAWFNLMCVASANGGTLPEHKVLMLKLRMSAAKVTALLDELIVAKLFDHDETGIHPHNWNARQYKSDASDATNADRQQRYRDRHRNGKSNVTRNGESNGVTPVTAKRPETDNRKQKEDNAPSGAPPKFAFESGCIRLNAKNLSQWKSAYVNLDVEAELLGLTKWAGEQGNNWFCAVSGALAKRNREVGIRKSAAQRGVPLTPQGNPWPEGIQ